MVIIIPLQPDLCLSTMLLPFLTHSLFANGKISISTQQYYTHHTKYNYTNKHNNNHRALTTFRKETEEGEEMELHGFEVAALMNLVATDTMVEEAVALIPSLSRFPESAVDEILDLIRNTMIRIVSYGS